MMWKHFTYYVIRIAATNDSPLNSPKEGDNILLDPILRCDYDQVQDLLNQGANVEEKGPDGVTVLQTAATLGHEGICRMLLSSKALVDRGVVHGPLHIAASNGFLEIADLMLRHGSDVNLRAFDDYDLTPLMYAAGEAYTRNYVTNPTGSEMVKLLLNWGGDIGLCGGNCILNPHGCCAIMFCNQYTTPYDCVNTPQYELLVNAERIIWTVQGNDVEKVREMLRREDVVVNHFRSKRMTDGTRLESALGYACERRNLLTARMVLKKMFATFDDCDTLRNMVLSCKGIAMNLKLFLDFVILPQLKVDSATDLISTLPSDVLPNVLARVFFPLAFLQLLDKHLSIGFYNLNIHPKYHYCSYDSINTLLCGAQLIARSINHRRGSKLEVSDNSQPENHWMQKLYDK